MARRSKSADVISPVPGERRGRERDGYDPDDPSAEYHLEPMEEAVATAADELQVTRPGRGGFSESTEEHSVPREVALEREDTGPREITDERDISEPLDSFEFQAVPQPMSTSRDSTSGGTPLKRIPRGEGSRSDTPFEAEVIPESTSHGAQVSPMIASMDFDSTSHSQPPDGVLRSDPTPADTPLERSSVAIGPEPVEHTTVDSELLNQLAEGEEGSLSGRESTRGSRPERRRSTDVDEALEVAEIDDVVEVTDEPQEVSAEPFEESSKSARSLSNSVSGSGSRSVSKSGKGDGPGSTIILSGERAERSERSESSAVGRLGPAFPENEEGPQPSTEMPTSARPAVAPTYQGDGPRSQMKTRAGGGNAGLAQGPGSGSVTGDVAADDDGWSDFQESSDEWGRQDSSAARKPSARRGGVTREQPKRKHDTGVYGPEERERPEPVVRLIVINAEDKGPIDIRGEDLTIGREADNQVVLKDPSISRKHARLTRVQDGWDLVDLHSGNGTFVNGKRIERALVKNNDEVRFGNAVFRFADTSDGLRAVDASAAPVLAAERRVAFFARLRENPRLRTIVYGSGILSCILLLTLALLFTGASGSAKQHAEVFELYLQGVEAFKQRHWVSAEGFFAAALQHDRDHQRSRRYLEAIAVEKRAEQALIAAKERLNAADLAGAYDNALQASDSLFFGADAQKLIAIVARDADERINRARAALAGDDKTTAKALLDGLEFYSAYRTDLNELRKQAGLPLVAGRTTNILQQYDTPTPRDERKRREDQRQSPEPKLRTPTSDAVDILAEGRIDEAISQLRALGDNREAIDLINRITALSNLYEQGREALRVRRSENAVDLFTKALTLLERMTGQRGELSKRVRDNLADALYIRGSGQYSDGKFDEAERTLKLATSYSERHAASVNLLTKIQTERR